MIMTAFCSEVTNPDLDYAGMRYLVYNEKFILSGAK